MEQNNVGFTRLTASAIVNEGATLLYGCVLLVSVGGSSIKLYEGLDAISGRLISTLQGIAAVTWTLCFSQPLYLDRGLFVEFSATVTEATIYWLPASAG
jgi:hypothetical protein